MEIPVSMGYYSRRRTEQNVDNCSILSEQPAQTDSETLLIVTRRAEHTETVYDDGMKPVLCTKVCKYPLSFNASNVPQDTFAN